MNHVLLDTSPDLTFSRDLADNARLDHRKSSNARLAVVLDGSETMNRYLSYGQRYKDGEETRVKKSEQRTENREQRKASRMPNE